VMAGFGSGEAIVGMVADPMMQNFREKKSPNGFRLLRVPGVEDKRLYIREGEAAAVFKMARKPESQADVILRNGWDGMPLQNRVKGKTGDVNNSAACQEPHISISGDTTRDELITCLPTGADRNGFGNRFLYTYVSRVKFCPNGGPQLDWTQEVVRIQDAIGFSKQLKYVPLTKRAHKVWNRMYLEMEEDTGKWPKMIQNMCGRGPAHVRRLALILALLDKQDAVDTVHLHAAKKLWDYCVESARFIFEGMTREQVMILDWLGKNNVSVTVRDVTDAVFHRNRKVEWVKTQMDGLVKVGKLKTNENDDAYWLVAREVRVA